MIGSTTTNFGLSRSLIVKSNCNHLCELGWGKPHGVELCSPFSIYMAWVDCSDDMIHRKAQYLGCLLGQQFKNKQCMLTLCASVHYLRFAYISVTVAHNRFFHQDQSLAKLFLTWEQLWHVTNKIMQSVRRGYIYIFFFSIINDKEEWEKEKKVIGKRNNCDTSAEVFHIFSLQFIAIFYQSQPDPNLFKNGLFNLEGHTSRVAI